MNPLTKNVKGFFALAIIHGRATLINNLNASGYPTPLNISDKNLVDKLFLIYTAKGSDEINKLLNGIKINESKTSLSSFNEIKKSLTGQDFSGSKTIWETFQEIWAGTSSTTGDSSSTTTNPIINSMAAIAVTIIGIIVVLIIAFKK